MRTAEIPPASPPPTLCRRVVAIVNPAARRDVAVLTDALRRNRPADVALDVRMTPGPGTITRATREALAEGDVAAVVAIGGDGTVAQVAAALADSGVPLGIMAAGSTNVIAREQRIPTNPDAAAALIYGPHALKPLDLGLCDHHAFVHIGGAGLAGRLFLDTDPALKRRLGWLAYLPAAAKNIFAHPSRCTIVTDDSRTEVSSPLVLVANGGSLVMPALRLYPGIEPDDGWLDILVFTASTPFEVIRSLFRLFLRDLAHSPYVLRLRARRVELSAEPPLPVQVDGDVIGETPALFHLAPHAVRLIVPAGSSQ